MACRATNKGFEAIAIERHFGVMRILSFAIPAQGLPADPINPTLRTDLAGHLEGNPNLEGLSFGQGSSVWLVVDNAYGRITGPNEVIRIPTL